MPNVMWIFQGEPPKIPKPIQIVIEKKIEEPEPEPEIKLEDTIQYKIDNDVYNCEPQRYIRADTAECGDIRPEYMPPKPQSTVRTATVRSGSVPSGWYPYGYCTYGAQQLAPWVGAWGNANTWDDYARAEGYTVSSTPIAGSVFVDNSGYYGHVGYVESVNGSTITVRDMNYSGFGKWTTRTVSSSNYVYIYP